MNGSFIESCHIRLGYEKKPGTQGSFYQCTGQRNILPRRISLGIFAQKKASQKDNLKKNEINGSYKRDESGLYSSLNGRRIHSSIWGINDYPEFYGYGILDERYGIYDLLILYSGNNCFSSVDIHLFMGLGKPEFLNQAFQYLRGYLNKSPN
jgi:hypothetical protein